MRTRWEPLIPYLPPQTLPILLPYFQAYPLHLKVVNPRKTKFGDYRRAVSANSTHRITINNNLPPHQFLITLVHELAHMHAFQMHGYGIAPHGKEWKSTYVSMLKPFVEKIPEKDRENILSEIRRPRASTLAPDFEEILEEKQRNGGTLVKHLPEGATFITERGQRMQTIRPLRTHVLCKELTSKRLFRVHGLAVVKALSK